MSVSSNASLGAIRMQAQQRADMENSQFVSTPEWNQYISQSYKELYDLLIGAYGNEYSVQTPYVFNTTGTNLYALPSDLYKLLGADIQSSSSVTGWSTMKRVEFIDRNKYSWTSPMPIPNTSIQLWYVPKPTSLSFFESATITASSTTIQLVDVTGLTNGMSVYGQGVALCTISSINTASNQITVSIAATLTQPTTLYIWSDATLLDGISGWEEYVVIDAAIKAKIKEESSIEELAAQKIAMRSRIESMAEGRDIGQASHTSDVLSAGARAVFDTTANLGYRIFGSNIMLLPVGSTGVTGDGCDGDWF